MTESYNGYPNWETWNMNLWLMNTESYYRCVEDQAEFLRQNNQEGDGLVSAEIIGELAEWLSEVMNEPTPDMKPDDVKKVDWEHIAEGWLS